MRTEARSVCGASPRAARLALAVAIALLAAAPATAQKAKKALKRGFYVTLTNVRGDEVLTACAKGYHAASLWELLDVSSLRYHASHPDAKTRDDSGEGPPGEWYGWVRTGIDAIAADQAGRANCNLWTTRETGQFGTIARLTTTVDGPVAPWDLTTWSCSGIAPVWCVSNKK